MVDPVPVRATAAAGFVALLVICMVPLALPAVAGAKVTTTLAVCPAASVRGKAGALWLKPVPVVAILLTVTAALEALLSVMVWFALEPVKTLPKATDCGLAVRVPCVGVGDGVGVGVGVGTGVGDGVGVGDGFGVGVGDGVGVGVGSGGATAVEINSYAPMS